MGVQQTEVDALAALRPDLLRQIAVDAIKVFYDAALDDRVTAVAARGSRAREAIDEQDPELAGRRGRVAGRLGEPRRPSSTRCSTRSGSTPTTSTCLRVPEPARGGSAREPLCDSRWDFVEQWRLIASKNYDNTETDR